MKNTVYTLVPSTNRGRYALDDSENGLDVTGGDRIALLLGGTWIVGHIEMSSAYEGPGCYAVADAGSKQKSKPITQEGLQRQVRAAMQEGMSLADAISAATAQVVDLFCGYYFIAEDGTVCGLCTGMKVRLP